MYKMIDLISLLLGIVAGTAHMLLLLLYAASHVFLLLKNTKIQLYNYARETGAQTCQQRK